LSVNASSSFSSSSFFSAVTWVHAMRKLLLGCLVLSCFSAQAQTLSAAQQSWRVTSRLGYGPTPQTAAATATPDKAKAWALSQIADAHSAAKKPPVIAPDMEVLGWDMAQLTKDVAELRERRRAQRGADPQAGGAASAMSVRPASRMDSRLDGQEMMATAPAATAPRGTMTQPFADDPLRRQVAQFGSAWRMQSCSNPAMEQPLLAKLTEFWFNHFNVSLGKAPAAPFIGHYVFHAIRPNVLGKFEDMVLTTAKHPAMLGYLDQQLSMAPDSPAGRVRKSGLNENYARELMELHTLGVNGGYTQNDVRELARILTGWTTGVAQGEGFRFAPQLHDAGIKVLLGRTFQAGGVTEGEQAIRMLARHPSTAKRVSLRLAQWFVADEPSAGLVDRLSQRFLQTEGDLQAVMTALVESPEFWAADAKLFKTPIDYACSVLTAVGKPLSRQEAVQAAQFTEGSGQGIHRWQTPDGYKVDQMTWLAPEALTRRADFAFGVAGRAADKLDWLAPYLSEATKARIAQAPEGQRTALMLASPEFMRK
jgi:uncharacterized protein (DUF1800 family)